MAQSEVLLSAEVLTAAKQKPAGLLEDRVEALTFHSAGLFSADRVERLVPIGDDVEAIEDMRSAAGFAVILRMVL
jgi:hypothetical protein